MNLYKGNWAEQTDFSGQKSQIYHGKGNNII